MRFNRASTRSGAGSSSANARTALPELDHHGGGLPGMAGHVADDKADSAVDREDDGTSRRPWGAPRAGA